MISMTIKNKISSLLGKKKVRAPRVLHYRIDWNEHSSFFCNGGDDSMQITMWYGDYPVIDDITGKPISEPYSIVRYNQLLGEGMLVLFMNRGEDFPISCISDPLVNFDISKETLIVDFERRNK